MLRLAAGAATATAAAVAASTQLDVGDRMPLADDNWERAHQSKMKGVEGSWGDRMSFLRAHHLVPDKYRHAIVAARNAETSHFTNGEI